MLSTDFGDNDHKFHGAAPKDIQPQRDEIILEHQKVGPVENFSVDPQKFSVQSFSPLYKKESEAPREAACLNCSSSKRTHVIT